MIGPSAGSDAIAASTHAGVLRVRSPLCTEMGWEEWGKNERECYVPFHDICPSQQTLPVLVNARQKVPTYHHRYRSREYGEENKHISALNDILIFWSTISE